MVSWWRALPEPLFTTPYSTVLLDRQGHLLGATLAADQQWRFPPVEQLSPRYVAALIAFEDRRFNYHPGVDPIAIGRALTSNWQRGRVVSGGSTLTMQLIRLARGNPPRTYGEKLSEALLALRLEATTSKSEILRLYASHAPFGGNIVGIDSASWRYFNRPAAELSWAEAALLAVLPNNPGMLRPGRAGAALTAKRDRLLRQLADDGLLTPMDLTLAMAEPLPTAPEPLPRLAPHLLDTLAAATPGQRIDSTIDRNLQQVVNDELNRHARTLQQQGIGNLAAVVIDNRTMAVVAYVGNSPDQGKADGGHAIDLIQRPRSSGSILKPFLYALMLEDGRLLPTTLVADIPTQINGYMPENYDRQYRGAVPAQEALALSLNIPAVRLLRDYGVARFHHELTNMGLTTLFRTPDQYGLTLILGGAEVTPWQIAGLYANLAAISRGDSDSHRYRPLQLRRGNAPKPQPDDQEHPAYGPGAAWLTQEAMQEVNRPGAENYWRNFSSSRRLAWKTGTSFGLRDAWAVGNSNGYTVAVWAGNANGEGVAGLSGTATAAPLLFAIHNRLPATDWFSAPLADLRTVQVCADDGYLATADCKAVSTQAPRYSHFERITPFHRRVHLDASGTYRVNSSCEQIANIRSVGWFLLPPALEFFYQRSHPAYRRLPPWRSDCQANGNDNPLALIYPQEQTRLYLPTDLDGARHEAVFEAVHRQPDALIYWHLDGDYLGQTNAPHQMRISAAGGRHTLVLVDQQGHRLERRFTILSPQTATAP